jgi:hypothetical protein
VFAILPSFRTVSERPDHPLFEFKMPSANLTLKPSSLVVRAARLAFLPPASAATLIVVSGDGRP